MQQGDIWSYPLNQKNYKYFALSNYTGTEQTWTKFFKILKMFETIKKSIISYSITNNIKYIKNTMQYLNELQYCFNNIAITRLSFYNLDAEYFPKMKTLLEYKGLLYLHNIPEVSILKIPYDTMFADELASCK